MLEFALHAGPQRVASNLHKHLQRGMEAALASASAEGYDSQTVQMALQEDCEALAGCVAKCRLDATSDEDGGIRGKLRKKLNAKRANERNIEVDQVR